jgi:hypothetical protein
MNWQLDAALPQCGLNAHRTETATMTGRLGVASGDALAEVEVQSVRCPAQYQAAINRPTKTSRYNPLELP